MSYYTELVASDAVEWLRPLLDSKTYTCRRSDGKFEMCPVSEPFESPWHHIGYATGANCPYLHNQLFQNISPRTPAGQFIPRRCQKCWKIVVRPNNLKQLFALEQLLMQLPWPSKCGIERRSYAPCLPNRYGGYIYNESMEEGLDRLDILRKHVDGFTDLGPDVDMHLKRACTEMEMTFPDSTTWSVSDEQNRIEDLLDWLVVFNIPATNVSQHILNKIHMGWIEWACENGDDTYLEYTDGKPIYRPAVRYERKAEGTDEGSPNSETVDLSPTSGEVPKGRVRRTTKKRVKK